MDGWTDGWDREVDTWIVDRKELVTQRIDG